MFKRVVWLVLAISSLSMPPLANAADTVGLLSMVSGDVQIVRAGQTAPVAARIADLLGAGDRVITGANAEATFLYCPESRAAKIAPQSDVQFDSAALAVRKGKLSDEHKVPTCRLPASLLLAAGSKLQAGNMRLRGGGLILRTPANTAVDILQPHFRWDAVKDAVSYDVKLQDREEHILWAATLPGTDAEYPVSAAALTWGQKYLWRVTAKSNDDTLDEAVASFQVMPSDQAEKVRASAADLEKLRAANPGDNAPLFLLAFLYEDNGMLDQAVAVYSQLPKNTGSQDWVQTRLSDLMGKLGWDKVDPVAAK